MKEESAQFFIILFVTEKTNEQTSAKYVSPHGPLNQDNQVVIILIIAQLVIPCFQEIHFPSHKLQSQRQCNHEVCIYINT